MDLQSLSIEDLTALASEKHQFAADVAAQDAPSPADLEAAEAAYEEYVAAQAEIDSRTERAAALRSKFASTEDDGETEVEAAADETEEASEEEDAEVEQPEAEVEAEVAPEPVPARGRVATLSRKVERPKAPAQQEGRIAITAAADVNGFGAGQDLGGIPKVAEALVNRLKAFGSPTGTVDQSDPNYKPDLKFAGVANFALEFPEDLRIERKSDDLTVIKHATDETRLEGKSLTAAGGWCTPSENLYDLCEGETLDGLLSIPEIQVRRGGINFTKGPDFATLFADPDLGFIQTEAQAEAGTTKPCYEIECPDWTDVRLDAVGLCIRVPILTNAAFPELTQRVVRGAMVAHQHKINASVISRMVTIAGAAIVPTVDYTATGQTLWANLARIATFKRQQYRMDRNETMEVVLPIWTREAIRDDLAIRGGRPLEEVTDAYMQREFAVRNLNVQFVYDWQELPATAAAEGYPATVNALLYPAGTFVKGVSDVISLNAVYDAASLATNVFTGLFFEEGLLVANTCYDADLVTIPVCNSGRTGAQSLAVCGTDVTP
jgi:hypothetical protein